MRLARGVALILFLATLAPRPAESQHLYLEWIGVIDNGEGDGVHGPHGNLHLTTYTGWGKKLDAIIIGGPSRREFLDGDQAFYSDVYLGTLGAHGSSVIIKIYESDPGPGRDDDLLFYSHIAGPGTYNSHWAAMPDAVRNAAARGAAQWLAPFWPGGVQYGMPMCFIRVVARH